MAKAVIAYDKDLPEIPGRRPWEKPTSYLVKDDAAATGWREETSGRRPSRLLLVPKIRAAVDAWRAGGYEGASEVTRRLFEYWFEEDHEVPGFGVPFRYYFCQREAIETLVWLVEIAGQRDAQKLIQAHATIFKKDLFTKNITFQTTMDGRRQLRRYVPELDAEGVAGPPARGPAPLRLQDGHRLGQDLGGGDGHRLGPLPQAAGAGLGAVHQLPDRRAERDRLPAAGARLRRQPDLLRAAADPAGVARRVRAEGDPARRGRRARPVRQPLPHQHPPALRVARRGVDAAERHRGAARQEAREGPRRLRASARCWSG